MNTNYAMNKLIIDAFEADGAVCNSNNKTYNEQATYEGGTASRLSFYNFNNKVNVYQEFLKIFKGEQRPEISETIPVIDFTNFQNTSFSYKYDFYSDGKINPTRIISIDADTLDAQYSDRFDSMLRNKDKSFINRAVLGEDQALFFFGSNAMVASNQPNILTTPYIEEEIPYYIYKGVSLFIHRTVENGEFTSDVFKGILPTSLYIETTLKNKKDYSAEEETIWINFDPMNSYTGELIESTMLEPIPRDGIELEEVKTTDGVYFIRKNSSEEGSEGYSLEVCPNDIAIILPNTSYTFANTLILYYKYLESKDTYQGFCIRASKVANSENFATLESNEKLPDYLAGLTQKVSTTDILANKMREDMTLIGTLMGYTDSDSVAHNGYLSLERVRFSDTPTLMSGLYSTPYEYTESNLEELGTSVSLWKMSNGCDEAKKKGVDIAVGTDYFKGHLMGRGTFLDSPLKLTSKDKSSAFYAKVLNKIRRGETNLETGKPYTPYKGKATYIYDALTDSLTTLIKDLSAPVSEWLTYATNNNPLTLTTITKKLDYNPSLGSAEMKDILGTSGNGTTYSKPDMPYYNKILSLTRTETDSEAQFNTLLKYLLYPVIGESASTSTYVKNGNLNVSVGWENVDYTIRDYTNKTWLFGNSWTGSDISYDTGNHLSTSYKKNIHISVNRRFKVRWKWFFRRETYLYDGCESAVVTMISPRELFSQNGKDNTTILLYTEYNKYLPNTLVLLSRYDLGLQTSGPRSMCTLYNDSKGKFLTLQCKSIQTHYMTNITSATVTTNDGTYTKKCGFGYVNDGAKSFLYGVGLALITGGISLFFNRNATTVVNGTPIIMNAALDASGKSEDDCFIYYLSSPTLSLDTLKLYDQDDKEVSLLSNGSDSIDIRPLAYPYNDFFKGKSVLVKGEYKYVIDAKHRITDIKDLEGSKLLLGLPKVDYFHENDLGIRQLRNSRYPLFADFYSNTIRNLFSKIIREGIYYVMAEWRLTDSSTNPILISNLSDVVDGVVELSNYVPMIASSGVSVISSTANEDGTISYREVPLTEQLNGIVERVNTTENQLLYKYRFNKITYNKADLLKTFYTYDESTRINPKTITFNYSMDGSNKSISFSKEDFIELNSYNKYYLGNLNIRNTSFGEAITNCLKEMTVSATVLNNRNVTRPSLLDVKNAVDPIFSSKGEASFGREDCEILDMYFGENTKPLLNITEDNGTLPDSYVQDGKISLNGEVMEDSDGSVSLGDAVSISVASIVTDASEEYCKAYYASTDNRAYDYALTAYDYFIGKIAEQETAIKVNNLKSKSSSSFSYALYNSGVRSSFEASMENIFKAMYKGNYGNQFGAGIFSFTWLFRMILGYNAWKTFYGLTPYGATRAIGTSLYDFALERLKANPYGAEVSAFSTLSSVVDAWNLSLGGIDSENRPNMNATNGLNTEAIWKSINFSSLDSLNASIVTLDCVAKALSSTYKYSKESVANTYGNAIKEAINSSSIGSDFNVSRSNILQGWKDKSIKNNPLYPISHDNVLEYIGSNYNDNDKVLRCTFPITKDWYEFRITLNLPKETLDASKFSTVREWDSSKESEGEANCWVLKPSSNSYLNESIKSDAEGMEGILRVQKEDSDISPSAMNTIVTFSEKVLNGTNAGGGATIDGIRFTTSEQELQGDVDSLYYKRYLTLNNRINKVNGSLFLASIYMKNRDILDRNDRLTKESIINSHEDYTVLPLSGMYNLSYFEPMLAVGSSDVILASKFYYADELQYLKASIGDKCILTCTRCSVRETCPFYNEDEILRMYCDEAQYIQIYVKDNLLDLIVHEEKVNNDGSVSVSPDLKLVSEDGFGGAGIDKDMVNTIHKPWSDIMTKVSSTSEDNTVETYDIRSLEGLRSSLYEGKSLSPNTLFSEVSKDYKENIYNRDDIGHAVNARYGTINYNVNRELPNENYDVSCMPKYQYLYNALFVNTDSGEDTEVVYKDSTIAYPVTLTMADGRRYEGTTKIKIPISLKVLDEANDEDDIYLVSDDDTDSTGASIMPVIYICKKKDLKFSFDLRETPIDDEVKSVGDRNLRAKDVAQFCINYYKGTCVDKPLWSNTNNLHDNEDQYWMESVYKKIVDTKTGDIMYIKMEGRPRETTDRAEPLMDGNNYYEMNIISGRPTVATYVNFIRKMMISMDCVQWVHERDYDLEVETQKSILPLMKTNLRLVIIHV